MTRHSTPWILLGEKTPAFDDEHVWELYDTSKDWSQANDLAKQMPEKLHELQRLWLIEAVRYNVLPLDDDLGSCQRINSDTAGRPVLIKGNSQILFGSMGRLSENSVLNIKNKSHSRDRFEITLCPQPGLRASSSLQGGNIGGLELSMPRGASSNTVTTFSASSSSHARQISRRALPPEAITRCAWSSPMLVAASARVAQRPCSWMARRSARARSLRRRP